MQNDGISPLQHAERAERRQLSRRQAQALARLEEIVRKLEANDTPLEQSLKLFEEGVALTARCNALLEKAEQQVSMLVRGQDGTMTPAPMPK